MGEEKQNVRRWGGEEKGTKTESRMHEGDKERRGCV